MTPDEAEIEICDAIDNQVKTGNFRLVPALFVSKIDGVTCGCAVAAFVLDKRPDLKHAWTMGGQDELNDMFERAFGTTDARALMSGFDGNRTEGMSAEELLWFEVGARIKRKYQC